jgi:transposase, IS5 family
MVLRVKAHVGVDSKTKIIHTAVATAANVADSAVLPDLLHGEETRVWGDQAYRGQTEVIRECAPQAQDCTQLFAVCALVNLYLLRKKLLLLAPA